MTASYNGYCWCFYFSLYFRIWMIDVSPVSPLFQFHNLFGGSGNVRYLMFCFDSVELLDIISWNDCHIQLGFAIILFFFLVTSLTNTRKIFHRPPVEWIFKSIPNLFGKIFFLVFELTSWCDKKYQREVTKKMLSYAASVTINILKNKRKQICSL